MPEDSIDSTNTDTSDSSLHQGVCKWFNNKRGYGFITVVTSSDSQGEDIFVHQSNIQPLNSSYRTLSQGEYIQFNLGECNQGKQAVNVKGINNGPLMCDNFVNNRRQTTTNSHQSNNTRSNIRNNTNTKNSRNNSD